MPSNFNSVICRARGSAAFEVSAAGLGLASGLAGFGWANVFEAGQIRSAAQVVRAKSLAVSFMVRLRFRVDDIRRSHPEHACRSQITRRKLRRLYSNSLK